MKLLLDTCTFLWILADDPRLSATAREVFSDPANPVFLSSASAWEIGIKNALGRLPLPAPAGRYIPEMREKHRITPLPLDEESCLRVGQLPSLHRDPFDRMLICQAISHGLTLLTPDETIHRYPLRCLW